MVRKTRDSTVCACDGLCLDYWPNVNTVASERKKLFNSMEILPSHIRAFERTNEYSAQTHWHSLSLSYLAVFRQCYLLNIRRVDHIYVLFAHRNILSILHGSVMLCLLHNIVHMSVGVYSLRATTVIKFVYCTLDNSFSVRFGWRAYAKSPTN